MTIDLIASILVGLLGVVSAFMFVRGLLGMFANSHSEPHSPW